MMIRSSALAFLGALSLVGCVNSVSSLPGDDGGKADSPISGEACAAQGDVVDCGSDDASTMYFSCEHDSRGNLVWSACSEQTCVEGQTQACSNKVLVGNDANGNPFYADNPGTATCELGDSGQYGWGDCAGSAASTPLLFSFDGRSAALGNAPGSFDVNPTMSVTTDWPSAMTPWLALDRNHNGIIDNGGELFGSATSLSAGDYAKNGFAALAELDQNHDGRIDEKDPAFNALKVWSDANQDRKSQPGELRSLSDMGIQSIELSFKNNTHCDERGNCEIEASTFTFSDVMGGSHVGRIADVHLKHH